MVRIGKSLMSIISTPSGPSIAFPVLPKRNNVVAIALLATLLGEKYVKASIRLATS